MRKCYPLCTVGVRDVESFPAEGRPHAKAQRRQISYYFRNCKQFNMNKRKCVYMEKGKRRQWLGLRQVSLGTQVSWAIIWRLIYAMLERFLLWKHRVALRGEKNVRDVWQITLSCNGGDLQEKGKTGGRKDYCQNIEVIQIIKTGGGNSGGR